MFETLLEIVGVTALGAPPALLLAGAIWVLRAGRTVSRARRRGFIAGLMSATIAYAAHFVLRWYLRGAHLGYWAEADTVVGIGGLMFLAAMAGLVAAWFGKGYGRITACAGSVLVGALWWLTGIATF